MDRKFIDKKIKTFLWRYHLALKQSKKIFVQLYASVDGFFLSKLDRQEDAIEWVYGEIEFEPFIALLSLLKPNEKTVFYDLGCGTGKAVLACALVFPIKKSVGIELLPHLYESAVQQKKKLQQFPHYKHNSEKIVFYQADFLTMPIQEATIVFVNATAFFGELWQKISLHLESLSPGAQVLSTSKAILSEHFFIVKITYIEVSWGCVKVFIQEKNNKQKSFRFTPSN